MFFRLIDVVDFLVAIFPVNFPSKYSLGICHQNFTTFFTMQFTISKEICHLVLTLGAISCKVSHEMDHRSRKGGH